jgi:hypothetical protein
MKCLSIRWNGHAYETLCGKENANTDELTILPMYVTCEKCIQILINRRMGIND